ncbi:MAG: hypothetical protein KKH72_14400 [Alphaproteobacteria bacterium]|nr:hypothetical protein [Alphaproteobacteria bacterium]
MRLAVLAWIAAFLIMAPAAAQTVPVDNVRLQVIAEEGYGRLVFDFYESPDLPEYKVSSKNGVLIIAFANPIAMRLTDIPAVLPDYVTVARLDPDRTGLRLGLKGAFRINTLVAGEKLFVDILPADWTGILPGLPSEVIDELSRRARDAAVDAERQRKAELVASGEPEVKLSVGRNPTFIRLQFDWNLDTGAKFAFEPPQARLHFALPVPLDLFDLKASLPTEIVSVASEVTLDGSDLILTFAEGVEPRFYENTKRQYVIDIDLQDGPEAVDIFSLLPQAQVVVPDSSAQTEAAVNSDDVSMPRETPIVRPEVTTIGATVRVAFPFAVRTAAAVFRRGDIVWLFFDTASTIEQPPDMSALMSVADSFDVVPANGTQIVRMHLSQDRLATLASEGQSWVLSLGDLLLSAEQPLKFTRIQDASGAFSMEANLENPAAVHELRDPEVGDMLSVVTAYPPSRAVVRALDFVDFSALKTVHGLAIKPNHDEVTVEIADAQTVVIGAARGLIVSAPQGANARDARAEAQVRDGYIDLNAYVELDLGNFTRRLEEMQHRAADAERKLHDSARLDLARFYLANQMGYEAIGVVDFLETELVNKQLESELRLIRAAANVAAGRPEDALADLNGEDMSAEVDAVMWRTIARADSLDFAGARADALASEEIVSAYPNWVQTAFLMAGIRAGLETGDDELVARLLGKIDTATLDTEQLTRYEFYSGRLDEAQGRFDEALDTYGQVIAADVRPTRAEAIFQTLKLLDHMNRLDAVRAAETLAAEVMVWRGGELEADMMTLLAELYFRTQDFRNAFETVHAVALTHAQSPEVQRLLEQARQNFADLYLNGQADAMQPVEALTLYYDYREFTPPGARGDEMVRNLARRLVKVDLLSQAAELLDYQISNRLEGAAKAQIAADLAVIDIADRKPDKALEALNISRMAGLPPSLERQRRVLEARALIDSGREDLALDLLASMDGRDSDLLRIDAHWRSKRYQDAAELIERLYSISNVAQPMTPTARSNIVRAAVGFVLANDRIGLSRLRSKFGEAMAETPEWPLFDFVTGEVEVTSNEFRKVAKQVADIDSLDAFLKSYSDIYAADGSLAPSRAADKG